MTRRTMVRVLGLAVGVDGASPLGSHAAQEQLGKVSPWSLPPVAAPFAWAIAMLHSFFYPETVKAFTAITCETQLGCAMAYWPLAMSIRQNPLIPQLNIATLEARKGGPRGGAPPADLEDASEKHISAMETRLVPMRHNSSESCSWR